MANFHLSRAHLLWEVDSQLQQIICLEENVYKRNFLPVSFQINH